MGDRIAVFRYMKGCHKEEGSNYSPKHLKAGRDKEQWVETNQGEKLPGIKEKVPNSEDNLPVEQKSLPTDIEGAPSLEVFKKRLDSHLTEIV